MVPLAESFGTKLLACDYFVLIVSECVVKHHILLVGFSVGLCLTACVSVKKTYTQSGLPAYSMSCSSPLSSWRGCLVKAGRTCGRKGYAIVYSDEVERLIMIRCNVNSE
jgi:hypothetical protein